MNKKSALGKGIASLLQQNTTVIQNHDLVAPKKEEITKTEQGVLLVDISQIQTNPNQPRKIFKEKEIEELSQSIKENGIIQPLVAFAEGSNFILIAGERRFRAAKKIGMEKLPVIIKKVTDREKLVLGLIENIQRENLNCVEVALGYFQLMEDFHLTQEELSSKVGKDRSAIANYLRILKLPRIVVDMLQREKLTFGHAKVLAGLKDAEHIKRCANEAIVQGLSVRELEKLIKKKLEPSENVRNKFFDEKLDGLRQSLEKKTGFHIEIKGKKSGSGIITFKYSNEAEFNDIYEFLAR